MSYQAKKPRKKRLTVKVQRMWYVAIEDETGCEVEVDYCFGTREDALREGEKMKKDILDALGEKLKKEIFDALESCGKE